MTDDLEQRLRAADPAPPTVAVDSPRSPRARTLVERVMTDNPIDLELPAARQRRPLALVAAAVAAVAVAGGGLALLSSDDGDDAPTSVALTVAPEDITQMCLEITPASVRDLAEVAFLGTVTAVDGETVTVRVDEQFTGDPIDEAVVTSPAEAETALLGGVALEEGGTYLISAADGAVNTCGQSGVASPELEAIYAEAFPG